MDITSLQEGRELGTGGLCTLGICWDDVHRKQQARSLRKWLALKKQQHEWEEPQPLRALSPRDEREQDKTRRAEQKEKMQAAMETSYRKEKALSSELFVAVQEINQERLQSVQSLKEFNKYKHDAALRSLAELKQVKLESIRMKLNVQRENDEKEMLHQQAREKRCRKLLRIPVEKVAAQKLWLGKKGIAANERLARKRRKDTKLQFLKQELAERSAVIRDSHIKRLQYLEETKIAREDRIISMKRVQRQAFLTSAKDILAQRVKEDEDRRQAAFLQRHARTPMRALSPMSSITSPTYRLHTAY